LGFIRKCDQRHLYDASRQASVPPLLAQASCPHEWGRCCPTTAWPAGYVMLKTSPGQQTGPSPAPLFGKDEGSQNLTRFACKIRNAIRFFACKIVCQITVRSALARPLFARLAVPTSGDSVVCAKKRGHRPRLGGPGSWTNMNNLALANRSIHEYLYVWSQTTSVCSG
jgi:hypothetical protein